MQERKEPTQKQVFYAAVPLFKAQIGELNTDSDALSHGRNPLNLRVALQNLPKFKVYKRKIDVFISENDDFIVVTFMVNIDQIQEKSFPWDNDTLKPSATISEEDILCAIPVINDRNKPRISLMQQDTLYGLSFTIVKFLSIDLVWLLKETPCLLNQHFNSLRKKLSGDDTYYNNRFLNGDSDPNCYTPHQPKSGFEPTLLSVTDEIRVVAVHFTRYKKDLLKLIADGLIKEGIDRQFQVITQMEQIETAILFSLMNLPEYKMEVQCTLKELKQRLGFIDMAILSPTFPTILPLVEDRIVPAPILPDAAVIAEAIPSECTVTSFSSQGVIREALVNLYVFPEPHAVALTSTDRLVLGDLHGNAIKLIHFLLYEKIMEGINKHDYDELVAIYEAALTENFFLAEDLLSYLSFMRQKILSFKAIIAKLVPVNKESIPSILLIGDVLADRGDNDFYTLLVLKQLVLQKIPTKILFSNHDKEFLYMYERRIRCNKFYSTLSWEDPYYSDFNDWEQVKSLMGMGNLLRLEVITKEEIVSLVDGVYLPMLTGIELNVDYKNKVLISFMHAPVPITIILDLVLQLKLSCDDEATLLQSPQKVIEVVGLINSKLKDFARNKELAKYSIEGTPLFQLAWQRHFDIDVRKINELIKKGWSVVHVHGHDGAGESSIKYTPEISTCDLDNLLGKTCNEGGYSIFYSGNNEEYIAERTKSIVMRNMPKASSFEGGFFPAPA